MPSLLSTSGDWVTVRNAVTGERFRARALVSPERQKEETNDRGVRRKFFEREVSIAASLCSSFGGADEPRIDWKVDVEGKIYDVGDSQGKDGGLVRLSCSRPETIEHARPRLREARR